MARAGVGAGQGSTAWAGLGPARTASHPQPDRGTEQHLRLPRLPGLEVLAVLVHARRPAHGIAGLGVHAIAAPALLCVGTSRAGWSAP